MAGHQTKPGINKPTGNPSIGQARSGLALGLYSVTVVPRLAVPENKVLSRHECRSHWHGARALSLAALVVRHIKKPAVIIRRRGARQR